MIYGKQPNLQPSRNRNRVLKSQKENETKVNLRTEEASLNPDLVSLTESTTGRDLYGVT